MGLFSKKKSELPPLEPSSLPSYEPLEEEAAIKGALQEEPEDQSPLFVKVDNYKHVLETLKKLRAKLSDAENVLAKLDSLKTEEDKELEAWKSGLDAIKNQLLAIDKKLFEV